MITEPIDEITSLKIVSDTLEGLNDKAAAERVVRWAWGKYVGQSTPAQPPKRGTRAKVPKAKPKGRSKGKKKEALSLIKDLNLKPTNGLSLADFVAEKGPTSIKAKIAVSVYYLVTHASVDPVTINHVYTSFKWLAWRLPSDLKNMIQQTGSSGWLDTGDLNCIQLNSMGENYVEHDLPKSSKGG